MSPNIVVAMSNNSGSSRLPLWQLPQQQMQSHQQANQGTTSNQNQSNQHQSLPLANYTLPGVINYLTSEFTNLERFKIMTNLEKSEMKYRITHLQGEMNSLKYINEQQKLKIQQLEKENSELKLNNNEPKNTSKDKLEKETIEDSLDIPEVDLKLIKDSRYQLTKSMKEVIHLLKSPVNTNIDYLEFPDINESNNAYDEFFNNDRLDNFVFNEYNNQSKGYSNGDDNNYNNDSKATVRKFFDDNDSENLNNSINDKFDKMNIDDEPNLESDTETVQGDVDFKFNNDGEIEPDIDSPNKEEKSPSNPKLEQIHTQSLSDPDLDKVRVFNNPINDVLVYVNYSSNSEPESDESKITILDVSTKQQVLVFNAKVGFIDNIEAINDIYCLSYNVEKSTANLLIINSEGRISQLAINDDDTISTLVLDLSSLGQTLNSSSLIKFDNNTSQKSPTFGLVVCIHEGKQSSFKIYELITAPRNGLRAEEINSFSKEFFKNIKPKNDMGVFEAIKWYTTDTTSPVNSNTQSPSQLKKLHKPTDSKDSQDSSLTPYKLLLKLDQTVFSFNIVSKQYDLITNYCNSTYDHNLEANDPAVVLTNPIDDSSYQIEIHNFTTSKDPNFVTIEKELNGIVYFAVDNLVVEVSSQSLNVYNYSFELLDSFSISSENCFRIGHYFSILNDSNLTLYSLSTKN